MGLIRRVVPRRALANGVAIALVADDYGSVNALVEQIKEEGGDMTWSISAATSDFDDEGRVDDAVAGIADHDRPGGSRQHGLDPLSFAREWADGQAQT